MIFSATVRLEVLVGRAVDDSHPAAIEHAVDAVAREERPRLEARQALNGFIHDSRSRRRHPRPCVMVRPPEPPVKAARSAGPGDPDPSEGVPERQARVRFEVLRGVFAGLLVRCAEPGGRLRLRGAWVWRIARVYPRGGGAHQRRDPLCGSLLPSRASGWSEDRRPHRWLHRAKRPRARCPTAHARLVRNDTRTGHAATRQLPGSVTRLLAEQRADRLGLHVAELAEQRALRRGDVQRSW